MMDYIVVTTEYVGKHPRLGEGNTLPVNLLLCYGETDMALDSKYDPTKHTVKTGVKQVIHPQMDSQDWFWNETTQAFQQTAP